MGFLSRWVSLYIRSILNSELVLRNDFMRYADAIAGHASPTFEYNHNPYPFL